MKELPEIIRVMFGELKNYYRGIPAQIIRIKESRGDDLKIMGFSEEQIMEAILGLPIRDPSSQPKGGWWIHKKTGHRYEIVTFALIEATLETSVVYHSEKGQVWIRPAEEFFDGRFQQEQK